MDDKFYWHACTIKAIATARRSTRAVTWELDAARSLGVTIVNLRVNHVTEGGQAHEAGIKTGWTIAAVNNDPVKSKEEFIQLLSVARESGDKQSDGTIRIEISFFVLKEQQSALPDEIMLTGNAGPQQGYVIQLA